MLLFVVLGVLALLQESTALHGLRVRAFKPVRRSNCHLAMTNRKRLGIHGDDEVVVTKDIANGHDGSSEHHETEEIPSPLHKLVDTNLDRNSIVYEVVLNRDIGIDIDQGDGYAFVSKVYENSRAADMGIMVNDIVVATSATAGTSCGHMILPIVSSRR